MLLRTEAIYHCAPETYLEQYFHAEARAEREVKGVGGLLEKLSAKQMPIAIAKDSNYFNDHMAPG